MTGAVEEARRAAATGDWREVRAILRALDREASAGALEAEDLELLADAAWWCSLLEESVEIRTRASARFLASGRTARAAYQAWFLYFDYLELGQLAAASGSLQRARRLLQAEPECAEHGYLALAESGLAIQDGDLARARELIERALTLGSEVGDPNLVAMAIQNLGRALIAQGERAKGVELLDEAMASVLAGDLSLLFTGWIFCDVLGACMEMADLRRAAEWTEAALRWCDAHQVTRSFHGLCLLYRVQITTLQGSWEAAETDARRATEYLMRLHPPLAAEATYALGEIRRRRGDLAGAEEAFAEANVLGRDPQPGLALVRLAQGRTEAATALRLALQTPPGNPLQRAHLLAAWVEVCLEAGDLAAPRDACEQLRALAAETGAPAIEAAAATAAGTVALGAGDAAAALPHLRRAWVLWQELRLPFEAARSRVALAVASRAEGDEERAQLELKAAIEAFDRLDATLEARRARALLGELPGLPGGLSPREVEVLRLVAAGKSNREIAAALVISEHTVTRHVHNIFTKAGVSSRAAATAFAFEHDLVPRLG